jgi:DNA mismatch endonuclease (patch repair protein)
MSDIFSKDERSEIMRSVRSRHNVSTEERLVSIFRTYHIKGWRRNYPAYGKPDFVFPQSKTAVFVDGCFWHGHDCRNTRPRQNAEFWRNKISRNMERDVEVAEHLENLGWTVLRIWECELRKKHIDSLLTRLELHGLLPRNSC